jgi:cytochrome d ubiquinol oxidase subunit II
MNTFLGLDYNLWWFLVFGAVISGYAILDGFDLGAGSLHLFLRKEESRRIAMNAIGPIWDGNEVWLVIGGGALFAGFPVAYAAIFLFSLLRSLHDLPGRAYLPCGLHRIP